MPQHLKRGVIIVAGAVPASVLALIIALPGVFIVANAIRDPAAIPFALLVLFACAGTIGLWAAAFDPPPVSKGVTICLILGIVAAIATPFVYVFVTASAGWTGLCWFVVGPVLVAGWLLWDWLHPSR